MQMKHSPEHKYIFLAYIRILGLPHQMKHEGVACTLIPRDVPLDFFVDDKIQHCGGRAHLEIFDCVFHLSQRTRLSLLLFLEHRDSKGLPSEGKVVPQLQVVGRYVQRLEQDTHAVIVLMSVKVRVCQVDVQGWVSSAMKLLETILVQTNRLRIGASTMLHNCTPDIPGVGSATDCNK